jgi:apolipoprotein D and lipocalin family protein
MKSASTTTAGLLMLLGLLLSAVQTTAAQSPSAVPNLDLNRYMGIWYEVGRLPNKHEKQCVSDAIVLFALADKPHRFQVVNSCVGRDGHSNIRNANGKPADKTGDGKLKVSYTWPFSAKYWVLAVDPAYEWVLVGSPNHKLLWILSRTATLESQVLANIEAKATAEGFATSKIISPQPGPSIGN